MLYTHTAGDFWYITGAPAFTWGLAHGEGHCSRCGYPARALHYNAGPINLLSLVLQYHPDDLFIRDGAA